MILQCPGCQSGFSVPDEKIPEGKGVRILCPKCRMPIEFKGAVVPLNHQKAPDADSASCGFELDHAQEEMSLLDMVGDDVRTALICLSDPVRAEKTRSTISQMGFYAVAAPKAAFAIKKLQNNNYDLIILDEAFDCAKPSANLFLHHVQLLPMHVRRKFFFCIVSGSQPTLDQMLAFRIGADLILNTQDLDKIKVILTRAIKDYEGIYKVFRDELNRKGQR